MLSQDVIRHEAGAGVVRIGATLRMSIFRAPGEAFTSRATDPYDFPMPLRVRNIVRCDTIFASIARVIRRGALLLLALLLPGTVQAATYSGAGTYTYTVPANTYTITVVLSGGGGGGGGYDNVGVAGTGGAGSAVTAQISVTPGQVVTITLGSGGRSGFTSGPQGYVACSGNGTGGSGYSTGGAGAVTNCGSQGYSGGGGGGGGSSTLTINGTTFIQAGGGGGGGGGGNNVAGGVGGTVLTAMSSGNCGTNANGNAGTSLTTASNNGDGGGGGGGGGGYTSGAAGTSQPDGTVATGGAGGGNCVYASTLLNSYSVANGSAGAAGPTTNVTSNTVTGTPGSATITPLAALTVTKTSAVLKDPVNGTSNPKMIPGATVQYCILVTNLGPGTLTNIAAGDALPANVTLVSGTLANGTSCLSYSTTLASGTSITVSGTTVTGTKTILAANATFAIVFNATVN
jgi:uncharacterized repeat protein (TIGR01451 family)